MLCVNPRSILLNALISHRTPISNDLLRARRTSPHITISSIFGNPRLPTTLIDVIHDLHAKSRPLTGVHPSERRPPVRTSLRSREARSQRQKKISSGFFEIFFVSILPLTPSNNHTKRGYTRNTRCITNLTTPDTHTQHPTFHTRPTPARDNRSY